MMQTAIANSLEIAQSVANDQAAQSLHLAAPDTENGETDLLITETRPPDGMALGIDSLADQSLPNFRLEGPVAMVMEWLGTLSRTSDLAPSQRWIVADIAAQARHFSDRTGSTHVALKLEIIRDNACRKLHHDYVAHRLVCTYRGPGTQWLPRSHEAELGNERDIVPDAWLQAVPRFAAALFSGRLAVGAKPVLHRSPPIVGTGAIRLVLTINEPFSGRH